MDAFTEALMFKLYFLGMSTAGGMQDGNLGIVKVNLLLKCIFILDSTYLHRTGFYVAFCLGSRLCRPQ